MSFNCLSNRPQCISNLFYPPWTLCLPSAVLGPCLYIYYIWDPAYIYYIGGLRNMLCSGAVALGPVDLFQPLFDLLEPFCYVLLTQKYKTKDNCPSIVAPRRKQHCSGIGCPHRIVQNMSSWD